MQEIQQSTSADPLTFFMVLSSDGKTGATGLSPTVTLSKNGVAFASPAGAVSEIANGWYKVAGNATDTATLGVLLLHATAATADPVDKPFQIVAFNPRAVAVGAAVAGNQMDLVNAPNATAIAALQSGLASASAVSTLQTAVNNLNNLSALAVIYGPSSLEVPASSSIAYPFTLLVKDAEGHLIDLSSLPTITAANAAGADRSSNISSPVGHPGTGQYTFTYTVAAGATQEGISIKGAGTASSDSTSRVAYVGAAIVAVDTATQIAAIKAKTDLIATNAADSPSAVTAQGNAATAATQSTAANTNASTAANSAATAVTQTTQTAIAGAVLATPTQKLATDNSGRVTTSNPAIVRNVNIE